MKARAFLFAVALLLRVSTAYPQAINLPVPNTSWVQIAGDDLFFANPNDQITTLRRWCDGTVRVIQPFEIPKGGSVALLAMHGTEKQQKKWMTKISEIYEAYGMLSDIYQEAKTEQYIPLA